ncbi:MAG: glucose-1-phosphate adenylyltransferase, partial [Candidatus Omnitrophota bacterium]
PFGGVYRIIDFTLSNCINSGLRRIYVLTQYKSASLHRHVRLGWNILSTELGEYIELLPAQQRIGESWYLGTADAIYQNIYTLGMERPTDVLILAGDHVYKMDYYQMIDFHRQNNADLTVAVVEVEKEKAEHFGIVEADKQDRVTSFQEKPKQPKIIPSNPKCVYASMGIYVFKAGILEKELDDDAKDAESTHDFGKDIIPRMLKEGKKVIVYNFKDENKKEVGYWRDIGTIDAYYEANMDLIRVDPVFNLYDKEWPIHTYQEQYPPAKTVFAGGEVAGRIGLALDSFIAHGSIISGGKIERSILSYNVRINSFSQVTDSILMEGVNVSRYAKVKRAIIDKDVIIPQGMVIGYDLEEDKKRFFISDSGIVVVAKGTEIK